MSQPVNQPTAPRPCIHCGWPTRSILRTCPDCKPIGKRPERPCSECSKTTTAKNGVCQACRKPKPKKASGVERICSECRIDPTTRVDGICYGCTLALKDDEATRGLQESHYDLDDLGIWRFDPVRRVEVWVPVSSPTVLPDPLDDSDASARGRMKALIDDVQSSQKRTSEAA